jgi:hypothetical protein
MLLVFCVPASDFDFKFVTGCIALMAARDARDWGRCEPCLALFPGYALCVRRSVQVTLNRGKLAKFKHTVISVIFLPGVAAVVGGTGAGISNMYCPCTGRIVCLARPSTGHAFVPCTKYPLKPTTQLS